MVPRVRAACPVLPWLILPTFDEAENLEAIVGAALRVARAMRRPEGFTILVVDDSSPDGTGDDRRPRSPRAHPEVEVLHRPERDGARPGLPGGLRAARWTRGAGYVLEMDADFSHDPADLARLPARPRAATPTSRWARATSAAAASSDWGLARRLVSRGGSWYARRVLGLDVRDLTGGFKCFRREVLEAIDLPTVRSKGYAFQVELTYRAVVRGFRVRRGPDHLPRPAARALEDVARGSRSRRRGWCRGCASARAATKMLAWRNDPPAGSIRSS